MAVVEYKHHIVGHGGQFQQPMWIREGGYLGNPDDHTMIGWVVDNAPYYIPDSLITFTKEELVQRELGIHANHPRHVYIGDSDDVDLDASTPETHPNDWREMTDAEVRAETETWYDNYVARCQGITR